MDPLDFGSLAHIRILLLPVGSIKQTTYNQWASEIKSFENIRLGDIPADAREDKARFTPGPLASGHIHLSFPSHPPPSSHAQLSLFRPSDFPLGVIGIATCSQCEAMPTIQAQFSEVLNDTVPEGSVFPLAKNCFVFEEGDSGASLGTHQGLVVIPGMMGNKKLYVGTLLADLCSSILAEFASVVQALETPLGNEYLNAALFPVLPPASDMPQPLENDPPMRSSLPPLPHQHSQPELATPASLLRSKTPTPLLMKRNSSVGPGPASPYRHSSLPVQSSKKKPATIGAVSSHGRLFKVLGDFFLLAGRTMDASVWYTEAIAMLKASQDNVWHASALEGLAIVPVLDAWSAEKPDVVDEEKQPWCDIADKLSQATSLYYRAAPQSDTDSSYSFVSWFYARAVLRHTYILYACWSAKGWGPLAFSTLLLAVPPPTLLEDTVTDAKKMKRMSYGAFQRLTTATGISRSMIADILSQSHGPWLLHLGTRERITILEHVAAMYGILGYQRKEAYVLREVLGCVMDLIVCGREETGGSRIAGTGLGIQGVDVGNGSQGSVGIRTNDNTIGNDSVLRVVKHICKVHGIDLEAVKLESHPDHSSQPLPTHDTAVDTNLFQDTFGWPELQIGIVREAIAVAEALPDYPSVAQFSLSALRTLHLVMSQGDQHHLYNTALKALSTAKRRGDSRCVEYWSGQPLVSIEIVPLPLVRLPLEKPISLLAEAVDSVPPVLVGKTDPFLYNPRRMAAGQSSTLLVQKEAFDVVITLRNPFVFDLELASLSLSTTGVAIEAKPLTLVVPANSFHPVTITAQSLEPGLLCIRGCIVQAPGGAIREFLLPLATSEEDTRHERTRSAIACESGRSKYSGLEARLWEKPDKRSSVSAQKMDTQFLQCKIVAEQPLLRIRRTSLTHGAVMLYNGERSSIRITLENVSLLPVDFIHLTFDDSTVAPAQQALTEGESSVFETYETEYDLIHRPMFTWDNKASRQDVSPGEKVVLTVSCSGKVGCTNGTIHISYAYCHRPRSNLEKPPEVFHTRQLSYPVLVTVYHMLECYGLDILPYTPDMIDYAAVTDENATKRMEKPLQVRDPEDWCIFSIEVRNTYGIPFEVSFEVDENDAPGESTMTLVPPGSTKRVILPLRRFRLPEEQIAHPIPTLSDRQFVVSKAHLSPKEESMQRELFWYREELLKRVRGRWKENGGSRFGDLSLRQQRLALPMLSVLQVEDIRVHLCIRTYGHDREPGVINCTAGSYFPPVDEFVYLHTKVTNMSSKQFTLVMDISVDPPEHVLYEGVLSGIPIGRVNGGESYEFETPMTFVACGRFDLSATTFIPGVRSSVGHGRVRVFVE